ncbi:hypothetical protein BGZ76_005991 [Entomortierella beljakovae]|nr:hypothetical protein BGZ76_005991 [Entomortierella beljakovae]
MPSINNNSPNGSARILPGGRPSSVEDEPAAVGAATSSSVGSARPQQQQYQEEVGESSLRPAPTLAEPIVTYSSSSVDRSGITMQWADADPNWDEENITLVVSPDSATAAALTRRARAAFAVPTNNVR